MKRITLAFFASCAALAFAGFVAGCGDDSSTGNMGLPDGFVSNSCTTVDDCAPTSCQTAKCNPVTKMCDYKTKVCSAESDCTMGVCDETADGACVQQAANEGNACTTMVGDPGSCIAGTCTAVPTCAPSTSFLDDAECDADDASVKQDTNAPMSFGGGSPVIGGYPCAPTETGPEVAYTLNHSPDAGDEDITISLIPVNADGTPASADDKDLDLIILEDACTATAKCMNPAVTGGFQGVTAGTAKERVTFRATAGKTYYVVVDGKDMNQIKDYVIEVEACGKCQPTDGTRLDCNMTMPINVNTATGAAAITDYKCTPAMTAVAAAGKEIPLYFRTTDAAVRNVTANLTGATADYKLFALPTSVWGQCDPDNCISTVSGPAATNSLTWKVDPGFNGFARYWLMVDTPSPTADTTLGIQLSCAPYCLSPYNLACGGTFETKQVLAATTVGSPKQTNNWPSGSGCTGLSGTIGPETAVRFTPGSLTAATYNVTLVSKTTGKSLSMQILDGGATTNPACDPTFACQASTVLTTGYSGTHTTVGSTTPAGLQFTATPGRTYFIIVDSVDADGGVFDMQINSTGGGGGCN